jgi:hypothetical protein
MNIIIRTLRIGLISTLILTTLGGILHGISIHQDESWRLDQLEQQISSRRLIEGEQILRQRPNIELGELGELLGDRECLLIESHESQRQSETEGRIRRLPSIIETELHLERGGLPHSLTQSTIELLIRGEHQIRRLTQEGRITRPLGCSGL